MQNKLQKHLELTICYLVVGGKSIDSIKNPNAAVQYFYCSSETKTTYLAKPNAISYRHEFILQSTLANTNFCPSKDIVSSCQRQTASLYNSPTHSHIITSILFFSRVLGQHSLILSTATFRFIHIVTDIMYLGFNLFQFLLQAQLVFLQVTAVACSNFK